MLIIFSFAQFVYSDVYCWYNYIGILIDVFLLFVLGESIMNNNLMQGSGDYSKLYLLLWRCVYSWKFKIATIEHLHKNEFYRGFTINWSLNNFRDDLEWLSFFLQNYYLS